jgi:16S rRNA (uracil1498-N3)-methyltransferase
MHRLYSPSINISGDKIIVEDKAQVHHLKDVLRLEKGETVIIFDEKGREYLSKIEELSPGGISFKIQQICQGQSKPTAALAIACAIPKKSKIDDIIDKLTQLGVDKIIPLETERVIVKLDKHKKITRRKRWEKIALSAAQQSQRNSLPVISPVKSIEEVLSESGSYDLKIIAHLTGERKTLKEIFNKSNFKNILVLIGPEGDFTPEEVSLALRAGFIPITLGDSVLRVETAAIAVVSFIRLR